MTVRQQWYLVGGVVALIALGVAATLYLAGDQIFKVKVGSRAPNFRAATVASPPALRTLDDYKGRVVLLNIWATWCEPCRVEMPSMEQIHREYSDRGLSVVAVSVDAPGAEQKIRDFVREYDLTFDILYDPQGGIERAYQTTGVPETFVIDRNGTLVRKVYGAHDWASLSNRAIVAQLLGDPIPSARPEMEEEGDSAFGSPLEEGAR